MCEQQCDPVMALLEELAQARGYALTPIIQPQEVAQQTEPDPLAEIVAVLEQLEAAFAKRETQSCQNG